MSLTAIFAEPSLRVHVKPPRAPRVFHLPEEPPIQSLRPTGYCLALSAALHGLFFLTLGTMGFQSVDYGMSSGSGGLIEVEMVAAPAPAAPDVPQTPHSTAKQERAIEPSSDDAAVASGQAPQAPSSATSALAPLLTATSGPLGDGSSPVAGTNATTQAGGDGGAEIRPGYYLNPPPPYPLEARRRRQEGRVVLEVEVTSRGHVANLRIKQTSGFPVLDQAALDAVRRWRFKPARVAGIPTDSRVEVPIRFELKA